MKIRTSILLLCFLLGLISCRETLTDPEEKEEIGEKEELPFADKWPRIIGVFEDNLILWVEDCVWEFETTTKQSRQLYCPGGRIMDFSYDGSRYFYISIRDEGLGRLDLSNASVQHLNSINSCLPTDLITAISAYENGILWCAAGTFVLDDPLDYTIGTGLIKMDWESQTCQQWDTTNSNIPFNTIMSMDMLNEQLFFSNVAKALAVYDYEVEYLVSFDGSQFVTLDSANVIEPLLRGVMAISSHEVKYEKYQDKDEVNDTYAIYVWDEQNQRVNQIAQHKHLSAANIYYDRQRNQYIFGRTKSVNSYNMVERKPFLIYNNADYKWDAIESVNSLYRFGTEDSIWVGSNALYHVPIP